MEDRLADAASARAPEPSAEQRKLQARRESLLLQRTRILAEMQAACNPRFRGQLEAELHWLDAELARLSEPA
jgi:hypothetical protein